MLARSWITRVRLDRANEYEQFAKDISLPMFRSHPGCFGVVMIREGDQCRVTTFWRSVEAMHDFEESEIYRSTVARILAAGFLYGEQQIQVEKPHLAWFRATDRWAIGPHASAVD